jgi:hypothetical protein
VVQFEYTTRDQAGNSTYGVLPSPIAVLTLDQDKNTGKLSLVKYHNVDMSSAHGLWITCGASLSPWGTHLSSEEYEPDAAFIGSNAQFKAYSKNVFGSETAANPYHYGHLPEVTVNADGTGSVKKHYCLGRISHELVQVMPDNRTVLMGDDYTNGGLFMFVADKEKDLSAGTLYVAKLGAGFSVDPAAPGAALTWINLGHATSAEIEAMANTLKAADIMAVSKTDPAGRHLHQDVLRRRGQLGQAQARHGEGRRLPGNPPLRQPRRRQHGLHQARGHHGQHQGQDRLLGAAEHPELDGARQRGLERSQQHHGRKSHQRRRRVRPQPDRRPEGHRRRGHQQRMGAGADQGLIIGEDIAADALGNLANPDKVANPDNLKFSEKLRTLFIGEDSGYHVNNFLWAYNVDTKKLSRIMSIPAGGESTGLHAVDEINGWTYIMSNFQHAGDWSSSLHSKVQATLDPLVKANYKDRFGASVGYLTGDLSAMKTTA